jgi:hypothetical protein
MNRESHKLEHSALGNGPQQMHDQRNHSPSALCFAESDAVDDACVIELVADHGIFRRQDRLKEPAVCIEAAGVQDWDQKREIKSLDPTE